MNNEVKTKKCIKCGEVKEITAFPKRKDSKDGYRSDCTECKNLYNRKYYKDNQQAMLDRRKELKALNKQLKKDNGEL